jgi:hypothetical protein
MGHVLTCYILKGFVIHSINEVYHRIVIKSMNIKLSPSTRPICFIVLITINIVHVLIYY